MKDTVTVAPPLEFLEHHLAVFGSYFHWIDYKRFAIGTGTSDDRVLLTALISHPQYHDHYAGLDAKDQDHHSVHGPYKLSAITADLFAEISATQADEGLRAWLSRSFNDAPDRQEVRAKFNDAASLVHQGEALYALPDLGEAAQHEWGWVVGSESGFVELVIINHTERHLTLLVASDD